MNWKEFKDAVESKGVMDDTDIEYIDIDGTIKPTSLEVDMDYESGCVFIV